MYAFDVLICFCDVFIYISVASSKTLEIYNLHVSFPTNNLNTHRHTHTYAHTHLRILSHALFWNLVRIVCELFWNVFAMRVLSIKMGGRRSWESARAQLCATRVMLVAFSFQCH